MTRELETILAKVLAAETMRARFARLASGEVPVEQLGSEVAKIASRPHPGQAVFDRAVRAGLVDWGSHGSFLTRRGRDAWNARHGGG